MPKWTAEQEQAIEKSGTNIIVSAGAGSGKTAVLSERVLYKLNHGIHIGELLILTFTRAAAEEMKDRIRRKIKKEESLKSELEAIDSAYITTFDSFALSVVKKYHYLLNIPRDIAITDESIVTIEKKKIIDELFEELYLKKDELFIKFITKYSVKNDTKIRKIIIDLINKSENIIDKDSFFDRLLTYHYSDDFIDTMVKEFESFIKERKKLVSLELSELSHYFDADYVSKIETLVLPILNTSSLEDFSKYREVKLPIVPRGTQEEAKNKKSLLKNALDELLSYTDYANKDIIKSDILSTKDTTAVVVSILKEYFHRMKEFKERNNIYTFSDIAELAIHLVKEYPNVQKELTNQFKEIMVDEYQDTNDIQETFINLIANNNVYMVGDIKQSIYRFRGSNPILFKEKYDSYSKSINGQKIDLLKNFRSRSEVLDGINRLFDLLMDDELGGAKYYESHEMVFGNTAYDTEKLTDYNYEFEVLEYNSENLDDYSNIEVEIFAIAKDIQNKVNSKMQVFDKETSTLRTCKYSDFVIILDRSKYFDLFKKIFEHVGIPLEILKDGKLNASTELLLIRNMLDFFLRINKKDYGLEFRYDFLSIGRSFLYEYKDEYLFDTITNNEIFKSSLYKDFSSIKGYLSSSPSQILMDILDKTEFYQKLNKIGDYDNTNVRVSSIYDLAHNLENSGYTIEDLKDYIDEIIDNDYEIKYTEFSSADNAVRILTIHKSKGLEYPVCYFADLAHDFNTMELKSKIIVDSKYGLIAALDDDKTRDNIVKTLYKNQFLKEEISEKIRLFYVALTRAREKFIIVIPNKETDKLEKNEFGTIESLRRSKFKSLSDFIYGVKPYLLNHFKNINLNELNLSKDYLYSKTKKFTNTSDLIDFKVEEINIDNTQMEEKHYSKVSTKVYSKDEKEKMEFGTKVHEILEYTDFKTYETDGSYIGDKVSLFINSPLLANISQAKTYHEYEFFYEKDNTEYHGIIDLMIEYPDHIDIVDYKLKDISDENYINQLNGYKNYISSVSNKKINIYLYSILDGTVKEI